MKQATYDKISRTAARFRRIEPHWYIGWAVFCFALGAIGSSWSAVTIGVMYLFMAGLANERNQAERGLAEWHDLSDQWHDLAIGWHRSSDRWKALYRAEKAKNGR